MNNNNKNMDWGCFGWIYIIAWIVISIKCSSILIFLGGMAFYFFICWVTINRKVFLGKIFNIPNNNNFDNNQKEKQPEKTKMTVEELERFMITCSAQIEHDEEMKQYMEYYGILEDEVKNSIQENNKDKGKPEAIIEKRYSLNGDLAILSLEKIDQIEIMVICQSEMSSAIMYLGFSIRAMDKYLNKFNFWIGVKCGEKTAITSYENGEKFYGGKEENGRLIRKIPDWIKVKMDESLKCDKSAFFNGIKEKYEILDEFMDIVDATISI